MNGKARRAGWRALIAVLFLFAGMAGMAGVPAHAQTVQFDVPAQPLAAALDQFARQARMQLLFAPELAEGMTSAAIEGTLEPAEAMSRLLQGTGLQGRIRGTTLTVEPTSRSGSEQHLPEVSVESSAVGDSPVGPDSGYVAQHSLAGTKTDTPLIETPQSISVVTRESMDDRDAQSIDDALGYVAGVRSGAQGYSALWDVFTVRGFQQSNASILRDGARTQLWNGDGRVETYGLERVEVLRGPASILYGSAAPGGVVNAVSKRPLAEPLREIELQAGSFDRVQGAFDLTGPIGEGSPLLYRLVGMARKSDTQIDYVPDDRTYLAPSLTLNIGSATSLTVLGEFQRNESIYTRDLPAQGTVLPNPYGKVPSSRFLNEPDDHYDSEERAAGYMFEHRFNDTVAIRQNLRQSTFDVDQRSVQGLFLQPDMRTVDAFAYATTAKTESLNVDTAAQISWSTGTIRHETLLGIDYRKFKYEETGRVGSAPPIDLFDPVYGRPVVIGDTPAWNYDQDQSQVGYYVQDQASIGKWRILLGGRDDLVRDNFHDRLSGSSTSERDDAFTWRAGVVYLFDSGVAPYASYTESFEPQGGADFNLQPFDPTMASQYEAGVRYQPPGSNAMLTVSAFELVRKNVLSPDPVNPGFSIQTGEVTSTGIEMELTASLRNGIDLIATATWNDVEVTESNDLDYGKRPTQVPEYMASAWGIYRFEGALAGLRAGGGVRYVGSTAGDFTNTFFVPSYTVADAMVSYGRQDWSVMLNAINLFDKEYVAGCWGMNGCSYGARRTLAATLKYQF
jgi:iron complex outermembrane receptor protein